MKEARPNRQSIRLKGWDYTSSGWYFVTINTHDNAPLFGAIVNGRMVLSAAGQVAQEEWLKSATIRQNVAMDEFVVMPNHVHGIVRIMQGRPAGRPSDGEARLASGSLGAFVAGYKGAVGRRINIMRDTPSASVWHRNYWDVIVRDAQALANIRRYIRLNPQNYQAVMQVGEPRFLGDLALLKMAKVGFLASRGKTGFPGKIPLRTGEAILSGFLSPMERALFQAGL
ncbi:MAG: transposase, partial [bacterium]